MGPRQVEAIRNGTRKLSACSDKTGKAMVYAWRSSPRLQCLASEAYQRTGATNTTWQAPNCTVGPAEENKNRL